MMSVSATLRPYISSRKLDSFFIIGMPILALLTISIACEPRAQSGEFLYNPKTPLWLLIGANLLTHSHVLLVFLRSHVNRDVFKRFPLQFTGIPLIMLAVMWGSPFFFGIMGFIAVYWDEWHSLMQTFGFGRIYDAKLGNDVNVGRKLDMGMCFVLGFLPHVIALTFLPEAVRTDGLHGYMDLDIGVAEKFGPYLSAFQLPLILLGVGYVVFYIYHYQKLKKNGYQFPKTKLALFATTGISAITIASFYSVADAAIFGNIYHALQYYFIVYISEGNLVSKKFGIKTENKKMILAFFCLVIITGTLVLAMVRSKTEHALGLIGCFWLLTSLLQFWYDVFIWSVRKLDI